MHTTYMSMSHSRGDSHLSHEKNTKTMQLEIDQLKRSLRHERRKRVPFTSDFSFDGEGDGSYRRRSRTPLNESSSYDKDYYHERRNKNPSSRSLGNDTMSKALNQISRSPFTRNIEGKRLFRRFTQPTFTMYNGRTDPVGHVSHFNQRMVCALQE